MNYLTDSFTKGFHRVTEAFGAVNVETPEYEVLHKQKHPGFEIRRYPRSLIATTEYTGSDSNGFKSLAQYIFGQNQKSDMTEEKIPMTAPVARSMPEVWGSTKKRMMFFLPKSYNSLVDLPTPKNPDKVKLEVFPEKFLAVKKVPNSPLAPNSKKLAEDLRREISDSKVFELVEGAEPLTFNYNPPWTIPVFKHQEIAWEVKRKVGE